MDLRAAARFGVKMKEFSEKLVTYLLGNIDGHRFESVVQRLLSMRHGTAFESLGGYKDGGADGELLGVYGDPSNGRHYVQISKEGKPERKIARTVKRLKEVGREVSALTYWTHRKLSTRDIVEDDLSAELGLTVRIRDLGSLPGLVNTSSQSVDFFNNQFALEVRELIAAESGSSIAGVGFIDDPTVYAYLKFEVAERTDRSDLILPVVDAMLYWALRDTDPDANRLLSRSAIKQRIADVLPGATNMLLPQVDKRLKVLAGKDKSGLERIRHYTKTDEFCLPFEMRVFLASESADDSALVQEIKKSLGERAVAAGLKEAEQDVVASATLDVIYKHFHEQGLALAAFLEKRIDTLGVQEQIVEAELQRVFDAETITAKAYSCALASLRGFFYSPTEVERNFQRGLSKTSLLLVSLKHSPQLIEYFNGMTANFRLIVGGDMLVKAMSEAFLPEESKTITNLLLSIKEAGAVLLLTEPVVNEVFTHLYATHLEFRNHYASREQFISPSIAAESDRILIRSYFHAKRSGFVKSWKGFVERFVDFDRLDSRSLQAELQLQAYLGKTYRMMFMSESDVLAGVDEAVMHDLVERFVEGDEDKHEKLARNDAMLALSVYAQRKVRGEVARYDGFGIGTWWLTKKTRILRYTAELVRDFGVPYVMRPEFVLNFLMLSPNLTLSSRTKELLPAHVGLQLGQHLSDRQMELLLSAVEEWGELPPERVEIKLSEFADKLKFDRLKQYQMGVDFDGEEFEESVSELRREMMRLNS